MSQPRALVVLDDGDPLNAAVPRLGPLRGTGAARNPGSERFFRVINTQGFQSGKPFLVGGPTGNVFSPPDFVPFLLQSAEQIFQVRTGREQAVNDGFQLCLVTGAISNRLMLNIALGLLLFGNDDGQTMLLSEPVRGAANLIVAALVGMVMLVIRKTDGIPNHMIMDMPTVNVCRR